MKLSLNHTSRVSLLIFIICAVLLGLVTLTQSQFISGANGGWIMLVGGIVGGLSLTSFIVGFFESTFNWNLNEKHRIILIFFLFFLMVFIWLKSVAGSPSFG